MTVQTEYQQAYKKRLAAIEADPQLTVLSSMNRPQDPTQKKVSQYIVFTDFKSDEQKQKTNSIYVYTPFENVDKYGHSKADYQAQLLFETNRWDNVMHITVLETLGSESRLAFYDFENLGLAQLALKAFLNLAMKADIGLVDGTISSFDKVNLAKLRHIFTKFSFNMKMTDPKTGIGKISRTM
ncbi:hypothetical protein BVJ53_11850 [Lacticaseibacillus chiayiensis]|uniref:Uncharacterized protein n=1 Tax=Lacticaseibacillus chiayiensis TaxID=2100821 RepID=A0A4Q1TKU5_9LACO|nr:hypothetical protein [Lacticaseibacillus chiayiensis]QVI33791.1 hypothetical protein KG086_08170 [Lacticaseibacillus chiayiensis]RXT19154.1 hypothetical protein BVJ53_11850 [Lacticaseibacillus chiayiensis]UYN55536.1 hypothetical protein OFW50_08505 [Lacticaseibacillus chiayiensis]